MNSKLRLALLLVATNVTAFLLGVLTVHMSEWRLDATRHEAEVSGTDPAEREPDRVVGVVRACEAANGRPQSIELLGGCAAVPDVMKVNDRQEVTVRTSTGGSYTVSVPVTKKVRVGQEWP